MKRISRIVPVGVAALALAAGGSTLATAKSHHSRAHAKVADVIKDVKDASKDAADTAADQAAAQSDATTPDSRAETQKEQADAQNEQADNQTEAQDGQQEGDSPAQAIACKGLLTDDVQYDDQSGTCSPESGQDNGSTVSAKDNGAGQDNNQND